MNKSEKKGTSQTKPDSLAVPQTSKSVGGSSAESKSHLSSSEFAKPENSVGSFYNKMSAYLALRHTMSLQAIKIKYEGEDGELIQLFQNINGMVDHYYKFVNYGWPAKWKTLSDIPLSTDISGKGVLGKEGRRRAIRKLLLDDYQMMTDEKTVTIEAIEDPDLVDSITRILPDVLKITQEAECKDAQVIQGRTVSEADCRQYWDQALSTIFTSVDIATSPQVSCERMVSYSVSEPERLCKEGHHGKLKACNGLKEHFAFLAKLRKITQPDLENFSIEQQPNIVTLWNHLHTQAATDADLAQEQELDEFVALHAKEEPKRGVPDTVVCIAYHSKSSEDNAFAAASDINKMAFIHARDPPPAKKQQDSDILSNPLNSSIGFPFDEARAKKQRNGGAVDEFQEIIKATKFSKETKKQSAENRQLLIPLLLVEHKKQKYAQDTLALNQCKLYTINAAIFMDKLGMEPRPIFGLVTHGRYGYITLTWKCKKGIALFEWNIARLDLTKPMDSLRLHIFLLRLHKDGTQLWESTQQDDLATRFFVIVNSKELDPNLKWKKDTGKAVSTGNEAGKRPDNAKSTGNKQRATKAKGK